MNETELNAGRAPAVDVVIPVYRERPAALSETLCACLKQTMPFQRIIVIDDGSPDPVKLPDWARSLSQIELYRLEKNGGISVARNFGIATSSTALLACINTDVLPDADWLTICANCLLTRPDLGACYTRMVSATPKRLLTRWRMRFLEEKFGDRSRPTDFAPGHAVLFRKEAVVAVEGYDPGRRLHHEDSDICHRMRKKGWETYYMAEGRCVSIQEDSLRQITMKVLREAGWYSPSESSLARLYYYHAKWTLVRMGRNVVKGRFYFLPIDAAIWAYGLWLATSRTLRFGVSV